MSEQIKVSIVCITYNHAAFIRDCLNGFVMQKTDFPFEILINDDASTDKTAEIIREYEKKYPHLFRCIYQTENQWGKKNAWNDILFPMVRGKYVALCEGDDYWTDPLKLQKQFDFLEKNPDVSVCFHPVLEHWEDHSCPDSVFPSPKKRFYKTELTVTDLLKHNFIQTNSVVYRWRFHNDPLEILPNDILPEDYFLHLLHAQTGKIIFLPDIMSVYRRHPNSIWNGAGKKHEWFIRCGISVLRFYLAVQKRFGKDYSNELNRLSILTYFHLRKANRDDLIKVLYSVHPPNLNEAKFSFWEPFFYTFFLKFCFGKLRQKMRNRKKLLKELVRFKREQK